MKDALAPGAEILNALAGTQPVIRTAAFGLEPPFNGLSRTSLEATKVIP
jgi:hypothetical protein